MRLTVSSTSTVFFGVLCLTVLLHYNSFFPSVFDWDESVYLIIAQNWLKGHIPYHSVYETHSIGLPALFAAIQLLFGSSIVAIRISACVAVAATGISVLLITRLNNTGAGAAFTAVGLYVAWMARKWSFSANTELYIVALVATAFFLVARTTVEGRDRRHPLAASLAAPLLLGLALQIKHVCLAETAFICLTAIASEAWRGLAAAARSATTIGLALAAPTALVLAYFWWVGYLGEYLDAVVISSWKYASVTPSLSEIAERVPPYALVPLGTATAGACVILMQGRRRSHTSMLSLAWCAAAVIDVALPRQFWDHYFILLAPPAAVLGGQITAELQRRWPVLPVIVIVAPILIVLGRPVGIIRDMSDASSSRAHDTPRLIANHIVPRLDPHDYIFVYNYQPIIYYLTNARLPTRYVLPGDWSEFFRGSVGVDPLMEIERIFSFHPRFVIVSDISPDISENINQQLLDYVVDYDVLFVAYDRDGRPVTVYVLTQDHDR